MLRGSIRRAESLRRRSIGLKVPSDVIEHLPRQSRGRERAKTHQAMSPNFRHVHSLGMPDMSFEPHLSHCGVLSQLLDSHGVLGREQSSLCLFRNISAFSPGRCRCRPSILLVTRFGFAASFGTCSSKCQGDSLAREAQKSRTSPLALALNRSGRRRML